MSIDARLAELGIELPQAAAPVAAYVPVVVAGGLAHVSGQLPFIGGALVTGRLGEDVSLEDGTAAARACALMILAQVKAALGSLDKVERVVAGAGVEEDLDDVARWGALVRTTSRCGLGATAANPILTTLEKFPEIYRSRLRTQEQALLRSFDLDAALAGYDKAVTELETDGTA